MSSVPHDPRVASGKPFYVTTPIYYVNDVPHLGTAYTTVVCDALKRQAALRGRPSRMLTGTDEHGQKIERSAKELGQTPQAFVDGVSAKFREAWPQLSVEADDFIRTTDERHRSFAQELWRRIEANGYLYRGTYDEWYCVGCESFKTEKELLPGNLCPTHKREVERVQEETYFFKLSAFQDKLLELYEKREGWLRPESRANEVISFVKGGLRDLSVSRASFRWGIPVPGDDAHVMYVWFDALSNYLSALGGVWPESKPEGLAEGEPSSRLSRRTEAEGLATFWPPQGEAVHIVGKDILRFHAVYWPAFLLAAGFSEAQLPSTIVAHGFLTVDGEKMSKSLRNAVDPLRLARELGPDTVRYHLLRAIAFGQDGDFSHEALIERYNADLGKNLGNLLSRTIGLCTKNFAGTVPAYAEGTELELTLAKDIDAELGRARDAWEKLEPHLALEAIWAISSLLNQYIDRAAPWTTAKTDLVRTGHTLRTLLRELERLSLLVWPAIPGKSAEMRAQLGLEPLTIEIGRDWLLAESALRDGAPLVPGAPLFPVIDKERAQAMLNELKPKPEAEAATKPEAEGPAAQTAVTTPAPAAPVEEQPIAEITYDDFAKVDLRAGKVVAAERIPRKDKLLKLAVEVGEAEPRTIVAGLALTFAPEDLIGRLVIVVANLAPRSFGKGLTSHGMLLASGPSESLVLATLPEGVAPGSKLK